MIAFSVPEIHVIITKNHYQNEFNLTEIYIRGLPNVQDAENIIG